MHRRIDWNVLKQASGVAALAAIVFGCAGNSGGGGTTSLTGTTATTATTATTGSTRVFPEVAAVNLPAVPALVQYVFLTGAGRDITTEVAVARNMAITDNFGVEMTDLTEKTLTLTSNQSQILNTNVDLKSTESRLFTTLDLNVVRYTLTDDNGSSSFTSVNGIPAPIPSLVRIFEGRQTHVPMYMDGATINTTDLGAGTVAVFDSAWFEAINKLDGDVTTIRSYLSDYVCFDVSNIAAADRPVLSGGNGTANRIFFSGDSYALGAGDPANGGANGAPFETIFPSGQDSSVVGRYSGPATLPSGIALSVTPGSYTTIGVDPSDVNATDPVMARKITSFQGIWKQHFQQRQDPASGVIQDLGYLKEVHPFEAVSIPSSVDDERQDVVFVSQSVSTGPNGAKMATINRIMWGYIDMTSKQLFLYPIKNIGDANATTNRVGEVAGTIGTLYNSAGGATVSPQKTRFVDFSFSTPPAGFPATGKIVVLRR